MGNVVRLASAGFAIADWDGHRVLAFDSSGALRRIVGREGAGPGEFCRPSLIQAFAGDSLLIWDSCLRRLTWLDAETGRGRSVTLASADLYGGAPIIGRLDDGRVVAKTEQLHRSDPAHAPSRTASLLLLDSEGNPVGTMIDTFTAIVGDVRGYRFFQPSLQVATDGARIFAGLSTQWRIVIYAPGGRGRDTLSRPWTPAPVSDKDRAAIRASLARPDLAPGLLDDDRFDPTVPAFGRILPSADGSIWVLNYAAPFQGPDSASVFSHVGRFLGTVALPPRFRPTEVGADYLVGTATRDDGDLEIRVYSVRWPARDTTAS